MKVNDTNTLIKDNILSLMRETESLYYSHFDTPIMSRIIDELPLRSNSMQSIRIFLSITTLDSDYEYLIYQGIENIQTLIWYLRAEVLPHANDKFGVASSAFVDRKTKTDRDFVIRKLIAYAFPHNLDRLTSLVMEIKGKVELYYSAIKT